MFLKAQRSVLWCRWAIAIVVVFGIYGTSSLVQAQNPTSLPSDEGEALTCPESTCRGIPVREKLTVLGHRSIRGVLGGFDQGAGVGGGVQFTTRNEIPNVTFRANLLISEKLARRVDVEGLFPKIGSRRNHADVWFSYGRYVHNFFGIGSRIPRDFKTDFTLEHRSLQAEVYRELAAHLQSGIYVQVIDSHSSQGTNQTDLPIGAFFSEDPTDPRQWAPGLFSYSKILSYGTYMLFDLRDNSAGLTRGIQIYGRAASYDGLKNHGAFEDFGWNEVELDTRGYVPLHGPKTSLAMRARWQIKATKGGSQVPFYDLSWLGGREFVRGYETFRLRGKNILMGSTELRRTVHSMSDVRGIDVFLFADSGQVWGDSRSLSDSQILKNGKFSSSNWHSGVGGGIQYRRSRRLAGRLEIGHSNEGNLVYASLTRGF